MTKAQALALMNALETAQVPASAVMSFDTSGTESWNVTFNGGQPYTGAQLAALTEYCTAHGLTLSIVIQQMGVV